MKNHAIVPSLRGVAFAAGLAVVTASMAAPQALAQQGENMQVTIGETRMQAGDLIGKPVMMKATRIGEVVDLIGRENTYNDVIIRLDREHSQMALVLGEKSALEGNQRPIIVGGRTIAVPFESLSAAEEGGLTVAETVVTSLDQFPADSQEEGFYTFQRGQTAELGPYDDPAAGGTAD